MNAETRCASVRDLLAAAMVFFVVRRVALELERYLCCCCLGLVSTRDNKQPKDEVWYTPSMMMAGKRWGSSALEKKAKPE